jgi:hypothetical protein
MGRTERYLIKVEYLFFSISNLYIFVGLPWRVMNLDVKFEDILDSSFLMNVLKVFIYV